MLQLHFLLSIVQKFFLQTKIYQYLLPALLESNIQEDSYYIGYENGYDEGYENGYNDAFEKSLDEPSYSEEYRSFNKTIANLMYDGEYETVRTLMSYYPDGVNEALEFEFGVTDINVIIDYLENEYNNNPPKINKTQ